MATERRLTSVGEPLRLAPEDRATNLVDLVHRSVLRHGPKVALTWKAGRRRRARDAAEPGASGWRSVSFDELWRWVERVAHAFDAWGMRPGDRVVIVSRSRPEWLVADLAALSLGAVTCPVYHAERDQRIGFILGNTGARFAIVETEQLARRVRAAGEGRPLEKVAVFDPPGEQSEGVTAFEELVAAVDGVGDDWPREWEARWRGLTREDVATVVHTSGTTDDPKGAILSHGNLVAVCESSPQALPFLESDIAMSVLPLSHIAERAGGQFVPLGIGASVTFAEPIIERWPQNLVEVRPTAMVTIPQFFSKMYRRLVDAVEAGPAWRRPVFAWATGLGVQRYANHLAGRRDSPWLRLQLWFAGRLVFRPLKQRVGGRLRFFLCGAAPLNPEIGELFYAMDMLILEAYGLTETASAICMNTPANFRFGTVGTPFAEMEIRLDAETGEVLIRGPQVFQGYLNLPDETAQALDADGWFHTGDVGELDAEGRLTITDRIKNILVLQNGKKVMPGPMENALGASPFIEQCVILGDHHVQTGVLVVPDAAYLATWAAKHGVAGGDLATLAADPAVVDLIEAEVRRLLGDFPAWERPRRVAVLPRPFTEEDDELSLTRKPKRRVIVEHFPEEVSRLWEGEQPGP
ncbi:MAG TPA: long-chain fatty acid--CoA ligase [Candidatus Limnocylindria bacterium]|nr:long-chain fatty acid--CoA ligase [Candidatus Limnocylindria bacterium]